MKHYVSNVEMHIVHTCNMKCKYCSHYCDIGYGGIIPYEEGKIWLRNWAKRLDPANFRILGGEPLLHPDIVNYVYLVEELFPKADRNVVTNGLLLKKREDILPILIETKSPLTISIHPVHTKQEEKAILDALDLANSYKAKGLILRINDGHKNWRRQYDGEGSKILPFKDSNPERSFSNCPAKLCKTIHQGKLWNCPQLAYLPMIFDKLEYKKAWLPYLEYKAVSHDATDEDILEVIAGTSKYCGMCPATEQRVEVTGIIAKEGII